MGLFNIFKRKKNRIDELFETDNLYNMVKVESDGDVADMYEPLDRELIDQTMLEEKLNNTANEKKSYAERLCEQIVICYQKVDSSKMEYKAVNSYLDDLQTVENAEEPIKSELEYYARRIITLREDKKSIRENATKIPESKYVYMQHHEHEIQEILKDIYDDEKECQRLKTDMNHIEGEKIALRYEQRDAKQKLDIMRNLALIGMLTAAIIIVMLLITMTSTEANLVWGIYGVIIAALAGGATLIVLHQKYTAELRLTERKMNKAVGLMNKYKLLYVNVKSRLDYLYEVHGVKSSYELNDLWRLYLTAKKEHEAFHLNADNTYKSIEGLIGELEKLHLYDTSVWPSQVDAIVDKRKMAEIRNALSNRRERLRHAIDFNTHNMENAKRQIHNLIEKNPAMAKEIMAILDKYESVLEGEF